jgi:hypothetical protein
VCFHVDCCWLLGVYFLNFLPSSTTVCFIFLPPRAAVIFPFSSCVFRSVPAHDLFLQPPALASVRFRFFLCRVFFLFLAVYDSISVKKKEKHQTSRSRCGLPVSVFVHPVGYIKKNKNSKGTKKRKLKKIRFPIGHDPACRTAVSFLCHVFFWLEPWLTYIYKKNQRVQEGGKRPVALLFSTFLCFLYSSFSILILFALCSKQSSVRFSTIIQLCIIVRLC